MYLRKSRQDSPDETVEEVLSKHETILQEYAERELGHRIPETDTYREVVSGESIDERVEIKKVLTRLEDPDVAGVLVVEPSRLSRGDLSDCARIIDTFRFSHSLIATPMMTYDLENKMERKFFQDELLRGNDYLEYTKEILFRGRVAAAKRGCFVSSIPPFGFDRVKVGKDWILRENDDADTVRLIFDLHVKEGLTPGGVARRLNSMGIPSPQNMNWCRATVWDILTNVHYNGKIRYNGIRTVVVVENGERKKRHLKQAPEDVIIAEGKHDGIVSPEIFEMAQERIRNAPRLKDKKELANVYAGVLRCAKCGLVMTYHTRVNHGNPRYVCRKTPPCMKMALAPELDRIILQTLEQAELPKLQQLLKTGAGDALQVQKKRLEKLGKQMEDYRAQEDKQYELLETNKYTQDLFDRRNAALRKKMEDCDLEIQKARASLPKNVDYGEAIVRLEDAIAALKDPDAPITVKNKKLRAIVKTINCTTENLGYRKTAISLEVFLRL